MRQCHLTKSQSTEMFDPLQKFQCIPIASASQSSVRHFDQTGSTD